MNTVVISSGHGKHVAGASGPSPWGLVEVTEARRVVDRVAELVGSDITVFHDDQSDDQDENLQRICSAHNARDRNLDVSVHFNSATFSGSNQTNNPVGCEVFYQSSAGQKQAKAVVDAICKASGLVNRGAKSGNLYFLSHTEEVAILIEVCFVNSKADVNIYNAKFDAICTAIAEAISDRSIGEPVEPPPVEEVPPPTTGTAHKEIRKGSTGPEVEELQQALGVLIPDGDFGSITDTWVRAFQGSCGLGADGIVGSKTWAQVDALQARVHDGEPPLPKQLADQIYTLAQTSEIADYSWPDRGIPPHGYIPGMALCFAVAYRRAQAAKADAKVMVQELGNSDKDCLAWYRTELTSKGLELDSWDGRLRALLTLQIGLGPRESSGRYFEGRDMSATNVQSETCEAGLTQTSWNIKNAHPSIGPLLPEFWGNPNGYLDVFKEGLSPSVNNLNSYGSGDGLKYQWLSRFCPLFHVLITAVGLRTLRAHWGPVGRREVTIKKEADDLLKDVQDLVESVA